MPHTTLQDKTAYVTSDRSIILPVPGPPRQHLNDPNTTQYNTKVT